MEAAFSTRRNIDEADKKEVVDLICRSLDAVVDYTLEQEAPSPIKAGLYVMQTGVNVQNLSKEQQDLCSKALTDFAVNGADYVVKGFDAATDIVEFSEIAEGIEPVGGMFIGGATALSLHAGNLYKKAGALVNVAYDVHGQCGSLSFDKVAKQKQPEASATALACYPPAETIWRLRGR